MGLVLSVLVRAMLVLMKQFVHHVLMEHIIIITLARTRRLGAGVYVPMDYMETVPPICAFLAQAIAKLVQLYRQPAHHAQGSIIYLVQHVLHSVQMERMKIVLPVNVKLAMLAAC